MLKGRYTSEPREASLTQQIKGHLYIGFPKPGQVLKQRERKGRTFLRKGNRRLESLMMRSAEGVYLAAGKI